MSENPYAYTGETQRQQRPEEPRPVEIPSCTLVQDLIPLYLDGEVSPESHVLIGDHIQQCERCSGYLAGARSVRTQILNEQKAVRAAGSARQTVEQVRQPITTGWGMRLWQLLMVLTYGGALLLALMGFVEFQPAAVMVGGFFTVGALIGLILSGSVRSRIWRALMFLTTGAGLLITPIAAISGGEAVGVVFYGLGLIGLGAWGYWMGQNQAPSTTTQPLKTGSNTALLTAVLSVLMALVCAGIAMMGLMLMLLEPRPEPVMIGAGLLLLGGFGLLLINQRRGWLPALATRLTTQQLFGYALIGAGVLLVAFFSQGLLYSLMPIVVVGGIGGGLAFLGYRLTRSS